MSYALSRETTAQSSTIAGAQRRLIPLLAAERWSMVVAVCSIAISAATTLSAPLIIAHIVDSYIAQGTYAGVLAWTAILFAVYLAGFAGTYVQARATGDMGRRALFRLRNTLFEQLQQLPIAFFTQNRSGDLISRINNDTERLNQFFAQALMQSVGHVLLTVGAGIALVVLNWRLGLAALSPAVAVLVATFLTSPWVKRRNFVCLQTLGGLSSEIQESLTNFKVIVSFNRFDYFRSKIGSANSLHFDASVRAGIATNVLFPVYGLAYNLSQLIVVVYGVWLIRQASVTAGLLIGLLLYVNAFYNPLRQLAAAWSSFQQAIAALNRANELLALEPATTTPLTEHTRSQFALQFRNVSFRYQTGNEVLRGVDLAFERGKTYALVGPTGGGKTTTALLIARLYDPTEGEILLDGRDIRSYSDADRSIHIGFILQEAFLFTGTVRDNLTYGNPRFRNCADDTLATAIDECGCSALLDSFPSGLDTHVGTMGDAVSLGQKQIVAFIRAALRRPSLLILDEATANIDTVTEQSLGCALSRLPSDTTRVIIAHRLNTIEAADEILFVNGGNIIRAGSMENALGLLLSERLAS